MNEKSNVRDVIPNDQRQAEIFKLKMDHFEEIFDWLSLKDLVALGQTCKRMQCIVGYWFRTNYAAVKPQFRSDGICTNYPSEFDRIKLNVMSSFLQKLVFLDMEFNQMKPDQFKSLKEILLTTIVITDEGISRIKEILSQMETVKIKFPEYGDENMELFERFLQFCTNVKKLCVQGWNDTSTADAENNWLQRKYPTLEHFELTKNSSSFRPGFRFNAEISELHTFFEQHPNIKTFATDAQIILANRNIFTSTKLKLDILSVKFRHTDELSTCRDFFNELFRKGLFKQLYLCFYRDYRSTFIQTAVNQLISFNALTELSIGDMEVMTDVSPLTSLKHFCIENSSYISNMETLAKQLVNLEFIQFKNASDQFTQEILPLFRYSPKLKTIVVFRTKSSELISKIDELNEERSKLPNARKITIYVEEHVYLAVKWAKNQTNWSLIEIKRGASYEAANFNFECIAYYDRTCIKKR